MNRFPDQIFFFFEYKIEILTHVSFPYSDCKTQNASQILEASAHRPYCHKGLGDIPPMPQPQPSLCSSKINVSIKSFTRDGNKISCPRNIFKIPHFDRISFLDFHEFYLKKTQPHIDRLFLKRTWMPLQPSDSHHVIKKQIIPLKWNLLQEKKKKKEKLNYKMEIYIFNFQGTKLLRIFQLQKRNYFLPNNNFFPMLEYRS